MALTKLLTFDEFLEKHIGQAMDYDDVAGSQCLDLTKYYLKEVFNIESGAWGNAHAWYDNFDNIPNLKYNFTRIANTPSFIPQRGDIMVWSKNLNGKWGHIAVCDGDGDTTYFYSYDQNWLGQHDPCNRIKHNYNHVLGVLRPNDQTRIKGKGKEDNTMNVFSKGIDIHGGYQTSVDFKKVKASGIDYVILHAGYGDTISYPNQKDPKFEEYYKAAKTAGLDVGIYWYSYAQSVEAAKREAQSCIEMLKGKKFEYPIYFDMEEKSQYNKGKAFCDSIVTAFCDTLNKAGYYSGLYCSTYYLNDRVSPEVAKKYALWVAQYNTKCTYTGAPYGMWQYSSTGHVDSISGTVDMDYCYINYPKLIKEAGKNGYPKSAELPVLDKTGFKKGDKGYEALALKTLLKLAVGKGLVDGKLDDTTGLGAGSIKIVNALLTKWKYKPNGIAGKNFINKLYKKLK